MRALDAISGQPWAIQPEMLLTILAIVEREADADLEDVARRWESRLRALEAADGRPLDGTHDVSVRDGVATLRVIGPISRYASLFSAISGMTSLETLRKDFETAIKNPQVKAVLLAFDSPGGEGASIAEFAHDIRAAAAVKPVWAYVDHLGASAAYWLAAATSRVVVATTAIVGSIGVVTAVPDPSKTQSREIEIVSSQSPNKRPDVTTEGGRSQIQAIVDAVADVFVADIAAYRGVTTETVLTDFGQGGVLIGSAAVTAGMADAVGTYEQTLAALATWAADPNRRHGVATTGRPVAMGFRDRFMSWLDGQDALEAAEQEATVPDPRSTAEISATPTSPQPAPAPIATPTTADATALAAATAQAAELRTQLARLQAERLTERADAFADQAIRASQMLPAVRAQLVAVYSQMAADDATSGPVARADGTSIARVELLAAFVEASPRHGLAVELLDPSQARALSNTATTPKPGEEPMPAERRTALLGATALGQAVVNGTSPNGKPHTA